MSSSYEKDDVDLCCLSLVKSHRCFGVGKNKEKNLKTMLSIFKDGNHHILEIGTMFEK